MPGLLLDMDPPVNPAPSRIPQYGFVVSHQKVELDIDFATQSLIGRCEITILPQMKDLRMIRVDARQCIIPLAEVTVNGIVVEHLFEDPMKALEIPDYLAWGPEQWESQKDRLKPLTQDMRSQGPLVIMMSARVVVEEVDPYSEHAAMAVTQRALGAAAARNSATMMDGGLNAAASAPTLTPKTTAEQSAGFQQLVVSIPFTAISFRDGLHFVGVTEGDARFPHVYTRHAVEPGTASCIFPCIDDPAMRCTWEISIKCSRTLGDALKRKTPLPFNKKERTLQHILAKKGLAHAVAHPVLEDYEIPLSDEEKLLEMTVVCSGELINETTDLEDSSKKVVSFICGTIVAPQHIGFAVGPFEQVDLAEFREAADDEKLGQGQSVPVLGYCLPGRSDELRHTCAPMAPALDWFLLHFGSYPFTECRFVFIDDQIQNTEHVASLSLCSNRLLFGEDIIDPEIENTRTLVHAIASQWIGVSIVPNTRNDRWATIGLSHYMAELFMKNLCGQNEHIFRLKQLNDRCVEQDVNRPSLYSLGDILHLGPFEHDFMALKALLVLSILDKRIFKASGSVGLTRVISKIIVTSNTGTSTDSIISTESFRKITEKITKYRQTEAFWNQWIFGAGCPSFAITQKFNKKRLCVEMTITQMQDKKAEKARKLEKGHFMRDFKEEIHRVYAADLQSVFTGPLTIRIHEADGTPYEHIIELREGHAKIEIPYNTKYKRLKRNRLQKERAAAADQADGSEDVLYYCLGDLLTSPTEMRQWGLSEWDAETEAAMAQESYEWLRVDADHEWICEKTFPQMKPYMYVSQLQQDRDIVAQYESMMYLKPLMSHPLVATFLVRTLMDSRYFYGIRAMGAEFLKTHAKAAHNWVGMRQLRQVYQEFFCYPGTKMPRSNDFTDKRSYYIEKAIVRSLSQIRDDDGTCPKEARQFLLDMLRFNDNTNNEFSDHFKIANILSALTYSLIPSTAEPDAMSAPSHAEPDVQTQEIILQNGNIDEGPMLLIDSEPERFKSAVVEELDRYRRMDEWIHSYQNLFTVTVLDCKQQLMKAKVIPMDPIEFAQYLHDGTSEYVRIKAFEALVDLGYMKNHAVLALLFNILSTDPSPFTRSHLFEVVCLGLATIAFGDVKSTAPQLPCSTPSLIPTTAHVNAEALPTNVGDLAVEDSPPGTNHRDGLGDSDCGLIIEEDVSLEARKAAILRSSSLEGALAALKVELKDNAALRDAIWNAIKSSIIGIQEQVNLLDICWILFDAVYSLTVKLKIPRYWKVKHLGKGVLHFKHSDKLRKKPFRPIVVNEPSKSAPTKPVANAGPVRLSISTGSGARTSLPSHTVPATKPTTIAVRTTSIAIKTPTPKGPTLVKVPSSTKVPTRLKVTAPPKATASNKSPTPKPPPVPKATVSLKPPGVTKPPPAKRALERSDSMEERPRKIVKLKPVDMPKVALILSRPPNPTPVRGKPNGKSASLMSKSNAAKQPQPQPPSASPVSSINSKPSAPAFPGLATPSSSSSPSLKSRKPLPEGRKPLPDGPQGSAARQTLPTSVPTSRTSSSAKAEAAVPARKQLVLKLKTSSFPKTTPKSRLS